MVEIVALKMPGQKIKFSEAWLSSTDSNGDKVGKWCQKGKDDYHGYCCLCFIDIKCDNGGKAQLLKCCMNKKHIEAIKHSKDSKQSKVTFTISKPEAKSSKTQPSLSTTHEATVEAVIYWIIKLACSYYSLLSSDHVGDLFHAMFPDSKIAENFSVSRTRASYIIREGLLPYFTQVIIDDLVRSKLPFSVHFDETTTVQVRKQMDLTLRYWSRKHDEVWTVFLYITVFWPC